MTTTCTRCQNTGFLNLEQLHTIEGGDDVIKQDENAILLFITRLTETRIEHDISVCDCCGDGDGWYGVPGEHYNNEDPSGNNGPYASNGGLCRCY